MFAVFARKEAFLRAHNVLFNNWYKYHIITLADLKEHTQNIYDKGLEMTSKYGLDKNDIDERVNALIEKQRKTERHTKIYQNITKFFGFEIRKV